MRHEDAEHIEIAEVSVGTRTRTEPASLWLGSRLSAIERLSFLSLLRHGMRPQLFVYEDVGDVPDGVSVRDANEILPQSQIFLNRERNSYAPFADWFRYRLLAATDFYWVDLDVVALRPFDFLGDHFLAWSRPLVNNSVLSLPKDSKVLRDLVAFCDNPTIEGPWLSRSRSNLADVTSEDGKIQRECLPYKALGPLSLTHFMRHHNETGQVLPESAHNPIRPLQVLRGARPILRRTDFSQSYSIHL